MTALQLRRPRDMGLLIVVGGPGGSGSSTIAKMLARNYGLHYVYGGSFLRKYAEDYGYTDIRDFLISKEFQENREVIDQAVDSKLLRASAWHDVLIDSKVFAAVATNMQIPCTVRIWLNASLHTRVRRTLHKQGRIDLSMRLPKYSNIYKNTEISLRDRYFLDKSRYKDLYGIDYSKPEKYNDIVIDTSPLNEGQTMELLLSMIKKGGYLDPK